MDDNKGIKIFHAVVQPFEGAHHALTSSAVNAVLMRETGQRGSLSLPRKIWFNNLMRPSIADFFYFNMGASNKNQSNTHTSPMPMSNVMTVWTLPPCCWGGRCATGYGR